MWSAVCISLIIIVFVFGLGELLRLWWQYLMTPKGDTPRALTVFLKDDICVQQLRSAIEYVNWQGNKKIAFIAAIDCGLSEKNKKAVEIIVNSKNNVIFGRLTEVECCIKDFCCSKKVGK